MDTNEPCAQQTLAVIIGASHFDHAPRLAQGKAFYLSAADFKDYLVSAEGLCMPAENVESRFDDSRSPMEQLKDIGSFLQRRTDALEEQGTPPRDLIVYYVGHGMFCGNEQTYSLAVRATDEIDDAITSIRVAELARIIRRHAGPLRKALIFDCCFSGAAYKEFQSGPLQAGYLRLQQEFPPRGTALFCAASASDVALAPRESDRTMFTSALIKSLRRGHVGLGPRLSMCELGDLVRQNLRRTFKDDWVRPEIHAPDQKEGNVATMPFFPNPAHRPGQREEARNAAAQGRNGAGRREKRISQAIARGRTQAAKAIEEGDLARATTILQTLLAKYPHSIDLRRDRESIDVFARSKEATARDGADDVGETRCAPITQEGRQKSASETGEATQKTEAEKVAETQDPGEPEDEAIGKPAGQERQQSISRGSETARARSGARDAEGAITILGQPIAGHPDGADLRSCQARGGTELRSPRQDPDVRVLKEIGESASCQSSKLDGEESGRRNARAKGEIGDFAEAGAILDRLPSLHPDSAQLRDDREIAGRELKCIQKEPKDPEDRCWEEAEEKARRRATELERRRRIAQGLFHAGRIFEANELVDRLIAEHPDSRELRLDHESMVAELRRQQRSAQDAPQEPPVLNRLQLLERAVTSRFHAWRQRKSVDEIAAVAQRERFAVVFIVVVIAIIVLFWALA